MCGINNGLMDAVLALPIPRDRREGKFPLVKPSRPDRCGALAGPALCDVSFANEQKARLVLLHDLTHPLASPANANDLASR